MMATNPTQEKRGGTEFRGGTQSPGGSEFRGAGTQDVKEKINRTKEQVAGAAGELRDTFSSVKEDVRDLAMTAGRAAREQLDPVEEYVREYPVRSLLMAVGAGMILGMIFRR